MWVLLVLLLVLIFAVNMNKALEQDTLVKDV